MGIRPSTPLSWLSRDARLILFARGLRSFGRTSVSVLLAIYLHLLGLSIIEIGLFISAGLAGATFFSLGVVFIGDTLGRRRLMVFFALTTASAALVLVVTDNILLLAVVAFAGALGLGGGPGAAPTQALEQVSLADSVPAHKRTDLYAILNIMEMGGGGLGTLAAALPVLFQGVFGLSEIPAFKVMFIMYAVLVALAGVCYAFLSPSVEVTSSGSRWVNPLRLPSRRRIFTLNALFSMDHFADGMIIQSLASLWFFTKFGVELESIAFMFTGFYVLSTISLWSAAKLANRIGLINTMVFTHVPANLLIIAIPFAPNVWMAGAFWVARGIFAMMDVPARQSYTMSVVGPNERSAMAGLHNVTRGVTGAVSPMVATVVWNIGSATIPFVSAGALRLLYDVALYSMFRNVKPLEEAPRAEEAIEPTARSQLPQTP